METNLPLVKDKRLFVVYFINRSSDEINSHYFYMNANATVDAVKDMICRFDQGDADPGTATYPVEIRDWNDVDPSCYNYIFFAEDQDLDQKELTLLEFMQNCWIYSNTDKIT